MSRIWILLVISCAVSILAVGDDTQTANHVYPVCSKTITTDCAEKPPKITDSSDPFYSEEGRRNHVSGTVVMQVVVGADGTVKEVLVTRSLGYGMDEEAIKAVRKWKFKPGSKDGIAVAVKINIEVSFRL